MLYSNDSNCLILNIDSPEAAKVRAALAADQRAKLMNLLAHKAMNVNEIAIALGVTQPTASSHVRVLEGAGLIECEYASGERGSEKRCWARYRRIIFETEQPVPDEQDKIVEVSMPIGLYTDVNAHPVCGLVSKERIIGFMDNIKSFLLPERAQAQLLWFSAGWVEYQFPLDLPPLAEITAIELSAEVCSEAPNYDNEFPSDITVFMNDLEIGTWTCPGDFGGKRGRITPAWWSVSVTQYGMLKTWKVEESGSYVDGKRAGDRTVDDLNLDLSKPLTVRIGVKPDSLHQGGLNLFGKGFGNYPQDLVLRIQYEVRARAKTSTAMPIRMPVAVNEQLKGQ